ncbi:MAG: PaaI family thioesterase [Phycisphaerales bacterium JB060]
MPPAVNDTTASKPLPQAEIEASKDARAPAGTPDSTADAGQPADDTHPHPVTKKKRKRTLWERAEAFISQLSTRNHFWHRVCSLIWLPYAFRSGIKMKMIDARTFQAVLPFRRFNRNWYNAMAGAALLGNAEIAGGSYIFRACGADWTVVCKKLEYKFLRPCLGPAVYRIEPEEDIEALVATGKEFNLTITMNVVQQIRRPSDREKRVGVAKSTFHVTPKAHQRSRGRLK